MSSFCCSSRVSQLCGGTMDASLWHLGSRTISSTYWPDASVGKIHAVAIGGGLDTILVGGQSPEVTAFRQDGSVRMKVSTSSSCVYCLTHTWDESNATMVSFQAFEAYLSCFFVVIFPVSI